MRQLGSIKALRLLLAGSILVLGAASLVGCAHDPPRARAARQPIAVALPLVVYDDAGRVVEPVDPRTARPRTARRSTPAAEQTARREDAASSADRQPAGPAVVARQRADEQSAR